MGRLTPGAPGGHRGDGEGGIDGWRAMTTHGANPDPSGAMTDGAPGVPLSPDEAEGKPARSAGGVGGIGADPTTVYDPSNPPDKIQGGLSRYHGPPPVVLVDAEGRARLAPYLLSDDDVVDLFRLRESRIRFPKKTLERYRERGLRSVRVSRRRWYTLPDVLAFFDRQRAG